MISLFCICNMRISLTNMALNLWKLISNSQISSREATIVYYLWSGESSLAAVSAVGAALHTNSNFRLGPLPNHQLCHSVAVLSVVFTMSIAETNRKAVQTLYRQSLRLTKSWINRRDLWREKALEIRAEFESNKGIQDPRHVQALLNNTQQLLTKYRHPDPIIPPLRPGGTKYERNIPPPPLYYQYREGDN